jgi:acetolactate synthase regulatory subunit
MGSAMLQLSCKCHDLYAGIIRILDLFRRTGFEIKSLRVEADARDFRVQALVSGVADPVSEQLGERLGEIVGVEDVVVTPVTSRTTHI